jgi:hypothetical protein
MVFNTTLNNMSVISCYWWRKEEDLEKTTGPQSFIYNIVSVFLYNIQDRVMCLYLVSLPTFIVVVHHLKNN